MDVAPMGPGQRGLLACVRLLSNFLFGLHRGAIVFILLRKQQENAPTLSLSLIPCSLLPWVFTVPVPYPQLKSKQPPTNQSTYPKIEGKQKKQKKLSSERASGAGGRPNSCKDNAPVAGQLASYLAS